MRSRRTGRGSIPVDVAALKALVGSDGESGGGHVCVKRARVADTDHYEVIDEAGQKDVFVDVVLLPGGEPAGCRLAKAMGGPGWGMWWIPPAGCEVIVLVPDGTIEADPVLLCALDNDETHPDLDPGRIVIAAPAGGEVYITDAAGGAAALATKADIDALAERVATHVHPKGMIVCTGGTVTGSSAVASGDTPAAAGTSVLKAK